MLQRIALAILLPTLAALQFCPWPRPAHALGCLDVEPASPAAAVEAAALIVTARVAAVIEGQSVALDPEAFLKGPAQPGAIVLQYPGTQSECPPADFQEGARVLVFLVENGGALSWPGAHDVLVLRSGRAIGSYPVPSERPESELLLELRRLTNQYAVPADTADDGASIGWRRTVLPIGAVVLGLFAIGLVLMRIWHRIDPS